MNSRLETAIDDFVETICKESDIRFYPLIGTIEEKILMKRAIQHDGCIKIVGVSLGLERTTVVEKLRRAGLLSEVKLIRQHFVALKKLKKKKSHVQ